MKKFVSHWPLLVILIVWVALFWPVFTKKLLPIPADIITGVYYPWLDYKWGFSVGVPVKNPLIADIPSILYPWRSFAIDELKSGRWPLWNPYYFTGMPLLANFQSAVFSYVNIFFLFLPKALAWSAGVMISPLLTLLAMYGFLRHKKLDKLPSLLGAVVFSLSGFEIAWLQYNVHGHTALFLPLLLLTIDWFFENKRWSLFLVPLFVAFQIFAGYIPVVIYTSVICLLYFLFFYFLPQVKRKKVEWKKCFFLLGFWIIGLGISAVQLIPGYELTSLSIRKTDPIVSASNASYLPFRNLVTLLAPDFFGNPATGNYFGTAFYDNFYFFAGTGTLIFVLFSLFFIKKKKTIFFWWGMLIFSFILCFKNLLGLFLEKILFLSGGVASKALFITDFSLSILAAEGFYQFFNFQKNKGKKMFACLTVVAMSFLIVFLFSNSLQAVYKQISIRNLVIPFMAWSSCSVLILAVLKFPKFALGKLLILLIISSQLLYSARKYLPFSKQELLFPTTPVIDFLKEKQVESKEPFRVELGDVIPQNFLMPYGIQTTSGYDALLPRKTGEFLSLLQNGKINERISRVHLITNYDSPLFPLLNTKYILAKKMDKDGKYSSAGNPPGRFLDKRYKLVFEDKTVQIYEDEKVLPRAFWLYDIAVVENEDQFLKLMSQEIDFSQKLILSEKINYQAPVKKPTHSIEWRENLADKKTMVVESDQPGFVFLADSFSSDWKAYLDGKKTGLLRADFNFQAVSVPDGKHLLTFKYEPKSFLTSGLISFFAAANLALLGLVSFLHFLWQKKK